MNALPARVAGVDEIIMVVPAPGGELNPVVLAAAHLAGVDRLFTIGGAQARSEEHTSELQSLMRISYAVFCLKKKKKQKNTKKTTIRIIQITTNTHQQH